MRCWVTPAEQVREHLILGDIKQKRQDTYNGVLIKREMNGEIQGTNVPIDHWVFPL